MESPKICKNLQKFVNYGKISKHLALFCFIMPVKGYKLKIQFEKVPNMSYLLSVHIWEPPVGHMRTTNRICPLNKKHRG